MELALSLGAKVNRPMDVDPREASFEDGLGLCMALGVGFSGYDGSECIKRADGRPEEKFKVSSAEPQLQLQLLPSSSIHHQLRLPCLPGNDHPGSTQLSSEEAENGSPNSGVVSFFQMDHRIGAKSHSRGGRRRKKNEAMQETDDEETGSTRKKLRLSKEQSAFLEESFNEHTTLNPKQKLALAEQLNLRPRQVEVWFQNRRARTKLKQTEVDCEFLKSTCERLREENKRLQKELQELRALKKTPYNCPNPDFFAQLPATTLSICSSCERIAAAGNGSYGQDQLGRTERPK